MTYSLLQLSDNEYQIYNETILRYNNVDSVDTTDQWLLKNYKSIHDEYLNICKISNDAGIKIEALKRLIFLNWYYAIEPVYFTGIAELNKQSIFSAYEILNEYIRSEKLDVEFTWMLTYYSSWEYAILEYSEPDLFELSFFINNTDTTKLSFQKNSVPKGIMDNRGQMGIYWKPFVEVK